LSAASGAVCLGPLSDTHRLDLSVRSLGIVPGASKVCIDDLGAVAEIADARRPNLPGLHLDTTGLSAAGTRFAGACWSWGSLALGLRGRPEMTQQGIVIPAKAGVQGNRSGLGTLDSRFRGNDD
jgi:hypothetical protein